MPWRNGRSTTTEILVEPNVTLAGDRFATRWSPTRRSIMPKWHRARRDRSGRHDSSGLVPQRIGASSVPDAVAHLGRAVPATTLRAEPNDLAPTEACTVDIAFQRIAPVGCVVDARAVARAWEAC